MQSGNRRIVSEGRYTHSLGVRHEVGSAFPEGRERRDRDRIWPDRGRYIGCHHWRCHSDRQQLDGQVPDNCERPQQRRPLRRARGKPDGPLIRGRLLFFQCRNVRAAAVMQHFSPDYPGFVHERLVPHLVVLGREVRVGSSAPNLSETTKNGLRRAALRRWRLRVRVDVARVLRIFLCADVAVERRMHDAPKDFPTPAS